MILTHRDVFNFESGVLAGRRESVEVLVLVVFLERRRRGHGRQEARHTMVTAAGKSTVHAEPVGVEEYSGCSDGVHDGNWILKLCGCVQKSSKVF